MAAMFKCRRCRTHVCDEEQFEEHQRNKNVHKMSHRSEVGTKNCSSLFLKEPALWMGSMSEYEGILLCPNASCKTKLGSWNWGGSQCSCGSWVTPSICLVESKLDKHSKNVPAISTKLAEEVENKEEMVVKLVDRSKVFKGECEDDNNENSTSSGVFEVVEDAAVDCLDKYNGEDLRCSCSIHWFATMPPHAVVVWLHGEGTTSLNAKEWVDTQWGGRLIKETQAAFIFPDCGVSPTSGKEVWYDVDTEFNRAEMTEAEDDNQENIITSKETTEPSSPSFLSEEERACPDDIVRLYHDIMNIISEVVKRGTPSERIFLGGVGHGGAAALHVGLRCKQQLGGVFSLGSSLPENSSLFSFLKARNESITQVAPLAEPVQDEAAKTSHSISLPPPVLCCHAKDDAEYACSDGNRMALRLKALLDVHSNQHCQEFVVTDNDKQATGDLLDKETVEWFSYNGSRHDGGIRTVSNFLSSILHGKDNETYN